MPVLFSLADPTQGAGFVRGALLGATVRDGAAGPLRRLRELAAGARQPLLVSKFVAGEGAEWGQLPGVRSVGAMEASLNDALASGAALINVSPFAGGTNFGEMAGRGLAGDRSFTTTSYDCGAPVSEGGRKTPKALALGLWSRWARTLEGGLLGSEVLHEDHPVVPSEAGVLARSQGDARVYFLHNPTAEAMSGKIQLEETIPFVLAPGERRAFAFNVALTPNLSVRSCTHPFFVEQLGTRTVVVLWGEPGQKLHFYGSGTLDVAERSNEGLQVEHERKGFLLSAEFSARPQRLLAKILFEATKREVLFLVVTRHLAEQASFDPGRGKLVLGSSEVDFTHRVARLGEGSQTVLVAGEHELHEDYLTVKGLPGRSARLAVTGALGEVELLKHVDARKDWREAAVGKDLAEYGFSSARAWYRLTFKSAVAGKKKLIFPDLEDQFAVFHRGQFLGLYGRLGKGLDLELPVKPGENQVHLLVHSWGRYGQGLKLGEKKGLILPAFDGGEVQAFGEGWHFLEAAGALNFRIFSAPTFTGRGWEIGGLAKTLERTGFVCARKKFKVPDWAKRVRLNLHAGDVTIEVALNGQFVGEHPDARGAQHQEFELTPHLIPGENTMALFFKGPTEGYQHCELLFLGPELKAKMEVCEGLYAPDETAALKDKGWSKSKKSRYGFWKASFKAVPLKDVESAWLHLSKNGRGMLWLNGRSLGRHWKLGPQSRYKLPLSWLKPVNELLVLEEEAGVPGGAEVVFEAKAAEAKIP